MGTIKDNLPQGSSRNKIDYLAEQLDKAGSGGAVSEYASYIMNMEKPNGDETLLGGAPLVGLDSGRYVPESVSAAQNPGVDDWLPPDSENGSRVFTMAGHLTEVMRSKGIPESQYVRVSGRLHVCFYFLETSLISSWLDAHPCAYGEFWILIGHGMQNSLPIRLKRHPDNVFEMCGETPFSVDSVNPASAVGASGLDFIFRLVDPVSGSDISVENTTVPFGRVGLTVVNVRASQ